MESLKSYLLDRPSAFLPVVMSPAALAEVIGHTALHGVVREADEGAAAHIWQVLMAGQIPMMVWYTIRWLKRDFMRALSVVAVQAIAFVAALAPVYLLGL